jgi:hypothetical protein
MRKHFIFLLAGAAVLVVATPAHAPVRSLAFEGSFTPM